MHNLQTLTIQDIPVIEAIALISWRHTYSSILSPAQLEYMLNEIYSTTSLQNQMTKDQHTFVGLKSDTEVIGFSSFGSVDEQKKIYKIHKLYLLPTRIGQGNGRIFVSLLANEIKHRGGKVLRLNVNRNNPAVGFYQKCGFEIHSEVDIPIGEFWMNDYVMEKEI